MHLRDSFRETTASLGAFSGRHPSLSPANHGGFGAMSGRCKPAVVVAPSRANDGHGETRPRGRKTGEMPSWQSQLSLFEGTRL
jgi:hypothetical protein